jgi:uncharacterized cupin superfamily protein
MASRGGTTLGSARMSEEARLVETESGLEPGCESWFVVNVADAAWFTSDDLGAGCVFESDAARFRQLGINLRVLEPGQPASLYHQQEEQESFLVLAGECLLVIAESERRLRAWDFAHCPPGVPHVFVGAGEGPCLVLMAGARMQERGILFPVSELAARHGASVARETAEPAEAYAHAAVARRGRPASWPALPWAR